MSETKQKPILFIDFDGTLCHDRYWRSLPEEQFAQVQDFLFKGDSRIADEWMLGKRTAEEVNQLLADRLGMDFQKLWDVFVADCQTMTVSGSVLEALNVLRMKYILILITTNMDSFTRFTVPALNLKEYFDDIVNSADVQSLKSDPSGKIFLDSAGKYSSDIRTSILIDDSLKGCEIFGSLGGKAHLVSREFNISYHIACLNS